MNFTLPKEGIALACNDKDRRWPRIEQSCSVAGAPAAASAHHLPPCHLSAAARTPQRLRSWYPRLQQPRQRSHARSVVSHPPVHNSTVLMQHTRTETDWHTSQRLPAHDSLTTGSPAALLESTKPRTSLKCTCVCASPYISRLSVHGAQVTGRQRLWWSSIRRTCTSQAVCRSTLHLSAATQNDHNPQRRLPVVDAAEGIYKTFPPSS